MTAVARYPTAPREAVADVLHGRRVPDPYRWLEDAPSPRTREWLAAQRTLADAWFAATPAREQAAARMAALDAAEVVSPPVWRGKRMFSTRHAADAEHATLLVTDPGRAERVILDPSRIDASGSTTLDAWAPSPDGRLLAYQLSRGGDERGTLRVLDVDTGNEVDRPIDRVRYSPVVWLPDGAGFYYVRSLRVPAGEPGIGPRRVFLHRLGAPAETDVLVFGDGCAPTTGFRLSLHHDRWLVLSASTGTSPHTDVWLADLAEGDPAAPDFRPVQVGLAGAASALIGRNGRIYLLTTAGAARGRIRVADQAKPLQWRELVPEDPDATIETAALLDGNRTGPALVVVRNRHGIHEVAVHDAATGARQRSLPLPGAGTVSRLTQRPDDRSSVWFSYTDHASAPAVFRYAAGHHRLRRHARRGGPREAGVTSRHVVYSSADGTPVRMFLIVPASCAETPDRPRPVMLTGYGGFGVPMTPRFQPEALAWVAAGGVAAIACVRGGGDEGQDWHRAGMRGHKPNSFADFQAAAEWLLRHGWTTPQQLGICGASNGGLLVGGALVQRPELYGAAVCVAPVLDMVRYERDGLGPHWRDEYGSADVPDELDWLLSYSPYHTVRQATAYPATLFMVKEGDSRVPGWHAYKLCAALQQATVGDAPILLRTIPDTGHGATARSLSTAIAGDILGFLAEHTGLEMAG